MENGLQDTKHTSDENNELKYENVRIFMQRLLSFIEPSFMRSLRLNIAKGDEQRSLALMGTFIAIVIMSVYYPDKSFPMSHVQYDNFMYCSFIAIFITTILVSLVIFLFKNLKFLSEMVLILANSLLLYFFNKLAFLPNIHAEIFSFLKNLTFCYFWWLVSVYFIISGFNVAITQSRATDFPLFATISPVFFFYFIFFMMIFHKNI